MGPHTLMLENWARPYLTEYDQKPHLFYAVLGEFELSDTFREVISTLAEGLSVRLVESGYFQQGKLWEMASKDIRAKAKETSQAIVIEGEVEHSDDLEYLRVTMDFLSYCCEEGGEVVYDPYTLRWYSSSEWLELSDKGQILNPFDHVVVLISDDWYHTRGMLKFGRPDLSVRSVAPKEASIVKKILDRFINFQALGGVVEEGRAVKMEGLERLFRPGPVKGNPEDPDFNNFHVELIAE